MGKQTVDIVRELVESLTFTFNIDSIVDNGDGTYTLNGCKTYQLQAMPNCTIEIGGLPYTITNVEHNESITITGNPVPTVNSFTVPAPFYFHGTVIQTNLELSQIEFFDRIPMVYLLEVLEDNYNNNSEIPLDRESSLRLFFLTNADFTDWKTSDHYKNAVLPMRNLADGFIHALNGNKFIDNFDNYTLINRVNFGVYTTDKGYTQQIFNDNLSGVEMQVTLPILPEFRCDEKCPC